MSLVLLAGAPGWTQERPERSGFWGSVQLGYGALDVGSDQEPHRQQGVFAMAFGLGVTPHRSVQLGVELGGWLLEGYDWNDPTNGESVSQVLAVAQVYPWPARGVFMKGGAGRAMYTNHHPLEFGSSGWGGTIGVGWDVPLSRALALTPSISWSLGSLGGVTNPATTISGRRYRAVDLRLALAFP